VSPNGNNIEIQNTPARLNAQKCRNPDSTIDLHYGPNGPNDFFQGVVRSVNAANKYDVVYKDYNEEEMGEAEFEIHKMKVKDQVVA